MCGVIFKKPLDLKKRYRSRKRVVMMVKMHLYLKKVLILILNLTKLHPDHKKPQPQKPQMEKIVTGADQKLTHQKPKSTKDHSKLLI